MQVAVTLESMEDFPCLRLQGEFLVDFVLGALFVHIPSRGLPYWCGVVVTVCALPNVLGASPTSARPL